MPEQTAQEPTMDEILASIRRIITDDEPQPGEPDAQDSATSSAQEKVAAEPKEAETSNVNEVEALGVQAGKVEPTKKASDDTVTVAEKDMPDTKVGDARDADADTGAEEGSLVSDKAATDTASAFAKLSTAVKESAGEPSMTMPAPGRSLEDVVRELLRPILKEWLETHLPEIVREHVEEEVARISRGRAR
jgi:hypothetical protein